MLKIPLFWVLILTYAFVVLGLVSETEHLSTCYRIEVDLKDSIEHPYVGRNDIMELLLQEENRI